MRCWFAFALLVSGCSDGSKTGVDFQSNCTLGAASDEAKITAGQKSDGSVILPGGRKLTPSGKVLITGGFPVNLKVLPGNRYVVTSDDAENDEQLRLVDLQAADPNNPVVSAIDYPYTSSTAAAKALFYGLAVTKDGKKLFVSDGGYDGSPPSETDYLKHYNVIEAYSITGMGAGTPPQLVRLPDDQQIHLTFNGDHSSAVQRLPSALTLSANEQTLFVVNQGDGTLSIIDLRPGAGYGQEVGRSPNLGLTPFGLEVDEAANLAYVALWGGQKQPSQMFDEGIVAVDITRHEAPMLSGAIIGTGKAAEALVAAGGKLFVATADADAISVIDPMARVSMPTPTAIDSSGLFGASPNGLVADSAHDRLYVANGGENAVQVFKLSTMQSLGRIPSCWYPTTVALLDDGTVIVACAKGLGGGPSDRVPQPAERMAGAIQVVPMPADADLVAGDAAVRANLTRPLGYEVPLTCTGSPKRFPLPVERAAPTPIKHVFLVVKENKTYDSVLGDLPGSNGKPELAVFGGDYTPNTHALAQRFGNLDNFYSNAEESLQGHHWTTAGILNDYGEKAWMSTNGWGRSTRSVAAFGNTGGDLDHLTTPGSKPIWQHLDAAGVAYHNYGEVVNVGGAKTQYDINFPGIYFAMSLTDVFKIQYVLDNLNDKTFQLEPFSYIGLPNDHTFGTQAGKPSPQSMIADNDEALGRLIDTLSHSSYWPTSAVFVIEDDPSGPPDHVELHRSICLVVSPWVRPGYTSSVHYDNPSMWKTITLLLGAGPMNLNDANAAAMYDLFATKADLRPYTFIPRKTPVTTNSLDAPLSAESAKIDFTQPDTADLGRILWKAFKGRDAEPPYGAQPVRIVDHDD